MAHLKLKKFRYLSLGFVDSHWFYRLWEIVPGFFTWGTVIGTVLISLFNPIVLAYVIIAFDLYWLLKSLRIGWAQIRAYRNYRAAKLVNWSERLDELNNIDQALLRNQQRFTASKKKSIFSLFSFDREEIKRYFKNRDLHDHVAELQILDQRAQTIIKPREIYQAIILANYNEGIDIVKPSIEALAGVDYDRKHMIVVLAYEERGGAQIEANAQLLEAEFADTFAAFLTIKHPDGLKGELQRGKGPNITFAGRKLLEYVYDQDIDPEHVIVTTLDADHRVDPQYLNYLTYAYCIDPNRRHKSFQPIPMFFNNIWDAPAPMRVIATGNSFWTMVEMVRPHRLRNFAAHAQGLATLVDTDFWSVETIVEDGHQYWRTFFTYDGDHTVEPLFVPIYQDAVLSSTYRKTIVNQFKQLQRWAWGASDIAFVVKNSMKNSRIPLGKKLISLWRLFEGHYSWATAPLVLSFAAWLPLLLNQDFRNLVIAHQLPVIASQILTLALLGLFTTIWISIIMLPPRPAHYRRSRSILMLLQWVLLPVTTLCFGAFAAINAQTRLMFGWRLEWWATDKVRK